jgi:hypothetical protein
MRKSNLMAAQSEPYTYKGRLSKQSMCYGKIIGGPPLEGNWENYKWVWQNNKTKYKRDRKTLHIVRYFNVRFVNHLQVKTFIGIWKMLLDTDKFITSSWSIMGKLKQVHSIWMSSHFKNVENIIKLSLK